MKKTYGYAAIVGIPFISFVLWMIHTPLDLRFSSLESSLYSLGQISGIIGLSLFSTTLFLNTRLRILEHTFGGLNKVFPLHHTTGKIAFGFIIFHPLFLFLSSLIYSYQSALVFIFGITNIPLLAGKSALIIFLFLIIMALWIKLPYHLWRFWHQTMGGVFVLISYHAFNLGADMGGGQPLQYYLYAIMVLGLGSFLYKTVFQNILIKKYPYRIKSIKKISSDILQIVMEPVSQKLIYSPGMFVFMKLATQKFYEEQHPFSFVSSPDEKNIKFGIKIVGDFTATLFSQKPGTLAYLEGPYGVFTQDRTKRNQIWIAGGIGITPFLAMMKQIKTKKRITLFYSVSQKNEAAFLDEIKKAQKTNLFSLVLWETKRKGRLKAVNIKRIVPGFKTYDIFVCGPVSMIKDLKKQLLLLGVAKDSIKSEEFQLLP
ncbi:MAG: ferric reductase-like transmembrane domain-containing protein [Patescibacteria group bacterium]